MQTQIRISGNSIYWKTFKWGEIIPEKSTFGVVPRTEKNIFKMFNGLGLNEEILFMLRDLRIKFIEVPFNGSILSTTVEKWIREGIRSRYVSDKVDRQIILPITKISLAESNLNLQAPSQLNLFQGMQQ
ncbi:MAG: hypothetical protein A2315_04840 [Ignavibacteria bacterium RIFOXYB2_FULL_35_12]|nr:MAG: hypothetical protein A2058_15745 [Ignavibacteria bacterium GWA2_36_19]OGU50323.1 MAG: hypothetical protein A2006_07695 [Ignavibacteria bacterium GWC2_35_8]OGU62603.1 MAG: hypothetical protein A2X60_07980 [Ignavibacteria bacterium GWF2_35_20]OGU80106.1 MAG: hypothetical protein A2254_11185 [Ignavibacteria bacterium RIFOXYA2_FULL_35_9]OGU89644.1 MAG: hypothetical protein A3K31_15790 [Ignavibacteria bacterium RIFOXYA12_FULL_35_25]OGU94660.1 MAG: hypothetical protein A2347_03370 [Ignavibac